MREGRTKLGSATEEFFRITACRFSKYKQMRFPAVTLKGGIGEIMPSCRIKWVVDGQWHCCLETEVLLTITRELPCLSNDIEKPRKDDYYWQYWLHMETRLSK